MDRAQALKLLLTKIGKMTFVLTVIIQLIEHFHGWAQVFNQIALLLNKIFGWNIATKVIKLVPNTIAHQINIFPRDALIALIISVTIVSFWWVYQLDLDDSDLFM